MKRITLIGTTHTEIGKCNIDELLNILIEIKPDLIFEEIPIKIFNDIYNEHKYYDTIEVSGIRKYLEKNQVKHIPVDGIIPENHLNKKINNYANEIFSLFEEENNENTEIISFGKYINEMHKKNGFLWINTREHDKLIVKKYKLIEEYFENHERNLLKKYMKYYKYHFKTREDVILNNIYNNSEEYYNGLLWIGFDHRPTIIQKINELRNDKKVRIEWNFYYKSQGV
jgi:hypothetical protein